MSVLPSPLCDGAGSSLQVLQTNLSKIGGFLSHTLLCAGALRTGYGLHRYLLNTHLFFGRVFVKRYLLLFSTKYNLVANII